MNNTLDILVYHNEEFAKAVKNLVDFNFRNYSPLSFSKSTLDFAVLDLGDKVFNFEYQKSFELQRERELSLLREFQNLEFTVYKKLRLNQLEKAKTQIDNINISILISWLSSYQPKIAVYAGSFNPFHKGHYNILQKAERIFDKVIVAKGVNPEKADFNYPLPSRLEFRQIDNYNTLLTDYLSIYDYPITLIRGLRNSTDFQYEMNQYRYLTDLKPDIRMVSVFCDKEFEHISSTGIRNLEKYGKGKEYMV